MKPWIPGVAGVLLVLALFPTDESLSQRWSRAFEPTPSAASHPDSVVRLEADLVDGEIGSARDTSTPPADPFGLPPEPKSGAIRAASPDGPQRPPPPRIWRATGRVGERAALLSAPDGRILVVNDGMRVDSAVVVSIGNGGVTLEDRAGRFVLRIP
ncbi:MAG: hypothetical protein RL173_820 [Fibrobacterota bacterium]|jgi:hypothetical protein